MEIRVTLKDRLRSLRAERGETQAQIAQIEDIVKRKTGIPAENIIISPVGEK